MGGSRRALQASLAGLLLVVALFVAPQAAQANVPQGVSTLWGTSGSGYADWRSSDRFLHVRSGPDGLGANQCTDAIFDWTRPSGHFDARTVRSCYPYGWHSTEFFDSNSGLTGMQKWGYCYGTDNFTTSGVCVNDGAAAIVVQGNVNVSLPNNCNRSWKRAVNNVYTYSSAGSSTSCTS